MKSSTSSASAPANGYHTEPERADHARKAPRCSYVKYNGQTCGCPALKGRQLCRYHHEAAEEKLLMLPFITDAASLQMAVNRVIRLLETDLIDSRKATAHLYALQLASQNLTRLADEMPSDPDSEDASVTGRVMAILDPPLEKFALVHQEIRKLVDLL